tara:strand:- start:5914 stop:6294 length:381 start_codon:yes stop_codon:yes gene_type:complete
MKNSLRIEIGLAILRISSSVLLLTHGIPKFQKLIGGGEIEFSDPIGIGPVPSLFLAVIGEVLCPILIIIGFKARFAAIPTAIMMAIVAFSVHASDPIGVKEKSLLFLTCFVAIIFLGPGKFSIDRQ